MSQAADAPKPVSRHAVTFVLITVFLDMVGFGLIMPVLPALITEVGEMNLADAAYIGGWMFAAFSLAQFAFSPLMGNLSDRFGRRPLLLLAIFGLGVDYLFSALAPTLFWLFVGRVIAGICGSSYVIANAYIADVTAPEDRAKAFGMVGAAFGVGFVLGPAIGGLLGELGPRVPFYVAAGISMLNFIYGWYVLPETLPPEKRRTFEWARSNPFGAFKVFRLYHGVVPLCAVLFVYFTASAVYPAIWPFWGMAKFGWSEAMVGLSLAVFGIITALFQGFVTGPVVARFGEWKVCLAGLLIGALVAAGYGLAGSLAAVIVLMILHGPEGFVHPMLVAMMSKAVPEDAQGELQGGISAVMNVAMLVGTILFSQVFGFYMQEARGTPSPNVAFYLAAAVLFGVTLMYLAVVRRTADN
jgi:MFS transporter, DHA1 family, tetracycline resistance protein